MSVNASSIYKVFKNAKKLLQEKKTAGKKIIFFLSLKPLAMPLPFLRSLRSHQ